MRVLGRDARLAPLLLSATHSVLGVALAAPLEVEVKPKDTLFSLAKAHETTVTGIKQLNGLTGDTVYVGQRLVVQHGEANLGVRAGEYLTISVAEGQTLYGLSRAHETSVAEIKASNKLADNLLTPGQQLRVPHRSSSWAAGDADQSKRTQAATALVGRVPEVAASGAQLGPLESEPESALWPLSGVLTQDFSAGHPGLDIAAPIGTPIYAARSGTVALSGWDTTGFGKRIVVNGVDGLSYPYAHASSLLVKRGDWVRQGDVLGQVGSTGNSTGPHLDFRVIRKDAVAISPWTVLPQSRVQLASTAARRGR